MLATTTAPGKIPAKDTAAAPMKHALELTTALKTLTLLWKKWTTTSVRMRWAVFSPKWSCPLLTEPSNFLNTWQASLSEGIFVRFKFQCPTIPTQTMSCLSGPNIFNTLQPLSWKEHRFGIWCLGTPTLRPDRSTAPIKTWIFTWYWRLMPSFKANLSSQLGTPVLQAREPQSRPHQQWSHPPYFPRDKTQDRQVNPHNQQPRDQHPIFLLFRNLICPPSQQQLLMAM